MNMPSGWSARGIESFPAVDAQGPADAIFLEIGIFDVQQHAIGKTDRADAEVGIYADPRPVRRADQNRYNPILRAARVDWGR
jgi:hypothetical protein